MAGTGYGDSDRESQASDSSGPGASPGAQLSLSGPPAQTFPWGKAGQSPKSLSGEQLGSEFWVDAGSEAFAPRRAAPSVFIEICSAAASGALRCPGYDCNLRLTMCRKVSTPSTPRGSPSVEEPPKFSNSSSAILRSLRPMIHFSRACGPTLVGVTIFLLATVTSVGGYIIREDDIWRRIEPRKCRRPRLRSTGRKRPTSARRPHLSLKPTSRTRPYSTASDSTSSQSASRSTPISSTGSRLGT